MHHSKQLMLRSRLVPHARPCVHALRRSAATCAGGRISAGKTPQKSTPLLSHRTSACSRAWGGCAQVLRSLAFLHALDLIHCDLKPENIMVAEFERPAVKIIDLGSSCFRHDRLATYVQSRSYRAPEVLLKAPYGPKIDIWSLGAILAELLTGSVLFPVRTAAPPAHTWRAYIIHHTSRWFHLWLAANIPVATQLLPVLVKRNCCRDLVPGEYVRRCSL